MNLKILLSLTIILFINSCAEHNNYAHLSLLNYKNEPSIRGYCSEHDKNNQACKQRIKYKAVVDFNRTLTSIFIPYNQVAYQLDAALKKNPNKPRKSNHQHNAYVNVSPFTKNIGKKIDNILNGSYPNKHPHLIALKKQLLQSFTSKSVSPYNSIQVQQQYTQKPISNTNTCKNLYKKLKDKEFFGETNSVAYHFLFQEYKSYHCQ